MSMIYGRADIIFAAHGPDLGFNKVPFTSYSWSKLAKWPPCVLPKKDSPRTYVLAPPWSIIMTWTGVVHARADLRSSNHTFWWCRRRSLLRMQHFSRMRVWWYERRRRRLKSAYTETKPNVNVDQAREKEQAVCFSRRVVGNLHYNLRRLHATWYDLRNWQAPCRIKLDAHISVISRKILRRSVGAQPHH